MSQCRHENSLDEIMFALTWILKNLVEIVTWVNWSMFIMILLPVRTRAFFQSQDTLLEIYKNFLMGTAYKR